VALVSTVTIPGMLLLILEVFFVGAVCFGYAVCHSGCNKWPVFIKTHAPSGERCHSTSCYCFHSDRR